MNRKKQLLALILTFVVVFTSVPGMSLFAESYNITLDGGDVNGTPTESTLFKPGDTIKDSRGGYTIRYQDGETLIEEIEIETGVEHTVYSELKITSSKVGKKFVGWEADTISFSGGDLGYIVLKAKWEDAYTVTYDLKNIEVVGEKPDVLTTDQALTLTLRAHSGYILPKSVQVGIEGNLLPSYTYIQNSDGTATVNVSSITGDVTITASGERVPTSSGGGAYTSTSYTIKALAKEGGTITPHGNTSVKSGRDQSFKIKPDEWHTLSGLLIDDKEVELDTLETPNIYTFKNVKANHTIEAVFTKKYKELAKAIVTFKIGESRYLVNEKEFPMDAASYTQDPGHTMIPVRYVLEAFDIGGGDISYEDKIIIIKMHGKIIGLTIGSDEAIINGISKKLRTKVVVEDGRTYAPIGEIVRLLDIQKSWDHEAKIATFINQ